MSTTKTTATSATEAETTAGRQRRGSLAWRVVDIIVAPVLAVAGVAIMMGWNVIYGVPAAAADAVAPGLNGIVLGPWLLAGVLGGLIIRKPGAALLVELLAAVLEMAVGGQWGMSAVYSGLAQGLGAELIFLITRYRRGSLPVAMLSGLGAALGAFCLETATLNYAKGLTYNVLYGVGELLSGLLIGIVGWLLVRALVATGVLDSFPAGRERRRARA